MTDISDFIEEELGIDVLPWQRQILDNMFPPPPPYVPPKLKLRFKVRNWYRRVILRKKPNSMALFDKALREVYAPGLRAAINESNTFMKVLHRD